MFHVDGPRELSQRLIYIYIYAAVWSHLGCEVLGVPASDCDIDKFDEYLQCGDYGTVAERSCERDIV